MSAAGTAAAAVCAAVLAASLISALAPQGSTKKLLNAVIGCFVLCSLIAPIKTAVNDFSLPDFAVQSEIQAESVPDFDEAVLAQTKENLEKALTELLDENGFEPESAEIELEITSDSGIKISAVRIYIEQDGRTAGIPALVREKFGVTPEMIEG